MITLIHAKNKPYSTITTKRYVIYICLYQEHVFHGLFPKWQTLPIIRSSVHFCTFLTRKSLMLRFTFLSHPPKRFAPHAQWQTTGAGLDSGTEAACPRPHRDAPLPFGTKVLNAPLHAHGSSGFWTGSKRGAGPIVQHLQEPFVNSARHPPVPCQAQRAARTSCLHLLPTAHQLAGGVEKPRAEAAALPERGKTRFIRLCRPTWDGDRGAQESTNSRPPPGLRRWENFAHLQLVKRSARNWVQRKDATFKISAINTCLS